MAQTLVERWGEGLRPPLAAKAIDTVCYFLENPVNQSLWEAGSRPEVTIVGRLGKRLVRGRMDRLLVSTSHITVVDYKTGQPQDSLTAPKYAEQMAIYQRLVAEAVREKACETRLVWVS
jgi:ATP-dependent helicase/nuclease subunit A